MTSSRLADIATIINTQNPDIVALQEVDNRSLGIFNHDYLSELAEILACIRSFLLWWGLIMA